MHCIGALNKQMKKKKQRQCNKQKIHFFFTLNMEFISLVKHCIRCMSSIASKNFRTVGSGRILGVWGLS